MNLHWDDLYKEVQHLDMPFGGMVTLFLGRMLDVVVEN